MIPPASPEMLAEMGGSGGRFSRGFRRLWDARATWQILRILLIVQAAPVVWDLVSPPGHSQPDKISQAQILLGLAKPNFLSGDFWRPLTYALIHANWTHLILNGAVILLLGSRIEHIAGKRTIRLVALAAALAGGFLFLALSRDIDPEQPLRLVGSSAVCFAFLVMLTTLSPDSRFIPFFVSGRSLGIGMILANLILALLNPDLPTGPLARLGSDLSKNLSPDLFRISHACHLGGSLAGFIAGRCLLRPRVAIDSLRKAREKREGKAEEEK
jgi:membrane associated rhomboid family serine protease